jgi:hypothetical protein
MNTSKAFIFNAAILLTLTYGAMGGSAQDVSQPDQPSVADAARKARADKKEQPKETKVFTNEDVAALKGVVNVVGQAPETPATPATADASKALPGEKKDEAYFRRKFAEARRTLADDTKELDVLQREFGLKQTQYYSDPNVAMREQYSREDLNKTQADIDAKKADVAKDQQAISDLEDDLRKSGGEPGWESAPDGATQQVANSANSPDETNPAAGNTPESNPAPASAPQENAPKDSAPQDSAPQ